MCKNDLVKNLILLNKLRFLDIHKYFTRRRDDIRSKNLRLQRTKNGTNFLCDKFFNKLPLNIKNLPLNSYKSAIKKFLLKYAFYSADKFLSCKSMRKLYCVFIVMYCKHVSSF